MRRPGINHQLDRNAINGRGFDEVDNQHVHSARTARQGEGEPMWGVFLLEIVPNLFPRIKRQSVVTPLVTQREIAANKKGLHFCNPLILLAKMAPPAGLEPATH